MSNMIYYRRRPQVVAAIQYTDDTTSEELVDFTGDKLSTIDGQGLVGVWYEKGCYYTTLRKGDWLVRDAKGYIKVYDEITFIETFEKIGV